MFQKTAIVLTLALFSQLALGIDVKPDEKLFKNIRIRLDFRKPKRSKKDSKVDANSSKGELQWLVVMVDYRTPSGGREDEKWLDKPVMDATVLSKADGGKSGVAITGRTSFFSIPLDGGRHRAMMFVPPQVIQRCVNGDGSSGKHRPGKKDFLVRAVFRSSSGEVLGVGYYGANEKTFEKIEQDCSKLGDMVYPLSRSPWSNSVKDRGELIL